MERRSFLKRLGILAGASLIPDKLLTATELVEKKINPAEPEKHYSNLDEFDYKKAFIKKWKASEFLLPPELRTQNFKEYWHNEKYRYGITFYIKGAFYKPNYSNLNK